MCHDKAFNLQVYLTFSSHCFCSDLVVTLSSIAGQTCNIQLLLTISSPVMALFFGAGLVSSIGRGFAKLRRNSEGKNNLTSGSNYSLANESELAPHSQSLSVTTHQGELSLPPAPPSATPVVMRKRKMSGEDVMPFSATKRWVGLWL